LGDVSGALLGFSYSRGHVLSGITRVRVDDDGAYHIVSDDTPAMKAVNLDGRLSAADRDALFRAIATNAVDATPSSSRPIGDDEVPVIVTFRREDGERELRIWDADARRHPGFHSFEKILLTLVKRLSRGAILTSVE
jgi:hypothetical protein